MLEHPYLWFKWLHIVSMVAWMAAMFYLPRLYVYHTKAAPGSEMDETFKIMERRLLRAICNPAMIATFVFGICLAHYIDWQHAGWFHAKIGLLIIMTAFHGFLARWRKDFARGENKHSEKFYRIANEIPTILLLAIVFLAVLKPF